MVLDHTAVVVIQRRRSERRLNAAQLLSIAILRGEGCHQALPPRRPRLLTHMW